MWPCKDSNVRVILQGKRIRVRWSGLIRWQKKERRPTTTHTLTLAEAKRDGERGRDLIRWQHVEQHRSERRRGRKRTLNPERNCKIVRPPPKLPSRAVMQRWGNREGGREGMWERMYERIRSNWEECREMREHRRDSSQKQGIVYYECHSTWIIKVSVSSS